MAEIRKHNPAAGTLGDLVRAAIASAEVSVLGHPANQGAPSSTSSPVATSSPAAVTLPATTGWSTVSVERLPRLTRPPATEGDLDDEDFIDDDADDDDFIDDDADDDEFADDGDLED